MHYIAPGVFIDDHEIEESFIAASGPGGQHVNKNATAVQIQFDAANGKGIPGHVYRRLMGLAGRRMNADGVITIVCQTHRSQYLNRQEAMEKLVEMVRKATIRPKKRKATKPTKSSQKKRMDSKTRRGKVKALRGKVRDD